MEIFHGNDYNFLLDTAFLEVSNKLQSPISVYGKIVDCFKCPDANLTFVGAKSNVTIRVDTKFDHVIKIFGENDENCSLTKSFAEKSVSRIVIKRPENETECLYKIIDEGINSYVPLYVAIGIYFILGSIIYILSSGYKRYKSGHGCYHGNDSQSLTSNTRSKDGAETLSPVSLSGTSDTETIDYNATYGGNQSRLLDRNIPIDRNISTDRNNPIDGETHKILNYKMKRIKSLDAFRGLTILFMIFVNYGAGGYFFLEHRPWYGITIADLIFPAFIFMMGISITLSVKSRLTKKKDYLLLIFKIIRRSLNLFFIGLILGTDFTPLGKLFNQLISTKSSIRNY